MNTRFRFKVFIVYPACFIISSILLTTIFLLVAHASGEVFTVNSVGDGGDSTPGNCVCATSGGVCTLRAAIQEANACSGGQTIRFNAPMIILLSSALPTISDDFTVIDGSTQWVDSGGAMVPGVYINGNGLAASGLVITASQCAIYGINVMNFGGHGIYLHISARLNKIGGEGTNQRNIIYKNGGDGILVEDAGSTSNTISSNYVGTDGKGYGTGYGNGNHGISVWNGFDNTITGNLIADNAWSGATMDAISYGKIINNRIGMDVDGDPLPNGFYGIHIANAANPSISDNQIAFNARGILVEGGSHAFIDGNDIYSNTATSLSEHDGGGVLITGASSYANLVDNNIYRNTAHFGGGLALKAGANGIIDRNRIYINNVVTVTTHELGGGGIFVKMASITAINNSIMSNTVIESSFPLLAASNGGGVFLNVVDDAWLIGNDIFNNQVIGNNGGGGGIKISGGGDYWVTNNSIHDNSVDTASYAGGGMEVNNFLGTGRIFIDGNLFRHNSTDEGGIVLIYNSDYITLTNNLIVENFDHGLYFLDGGDHNHINFNTIAWNDGSGIILDDTSANLYNTLVVKNKNYGVEASGSWGLTISRNDVWGNSLGASNLPISFYMTLDPQFFNGLEGIFALRRSSPCLDAGASGHPLSTSYNGVHRPQGGGYDIGAYEMPLPTWLPIMLK